MTGPITVAYTDDPPRAWLAVHGSPVCSLNDKIAKAVEVQIAPQTLRIVDAMGTLPVGVPADLTELREAVERVELADMTLDHLPDTEMARAEFTSSWASLYTAVYRLTHPEVGA